MNLLFVMGTRPEVIKMATLIHQAKEVFNVEVCSTGQHRDMLYSACDALDISVDVDLDVMQYAPMSLSEMTSRLIIGLEEVIRSRKIDWVIVQGDTTTAFVAGLVAFYHQIKVAHVEAGLRSFNIFHPFPEEVNRKLISTFADLHLAPTELSKNQLLKEGVAKEKIYLTGNTVIDALFYSRDKIAKDKNLQSTILDKYAFLKEDKKTVLVTCHRRENHGINLAHICEGLKKLARTYPDISFIFPVHLNPKVREVVYPMLDDISNIKLIEPIDYLEMVYLLDNAYFVITDSGGIQEEVTAFAKPTLILRQTTERMESIQAGVAKLIGTNSDTIFSEAKKLIEDKAHFKQMSQKAYPYGDGTASEKIIDVLIRAPLAKQSCALRERPRA